MDVVTLSRLQFAVTAMFHFIFVPLTMGLSLLLAYWETRYVRTGDETYLRMTRFWGKLFLINFALGVVTGITKEFEFGMNWARYSAFAGDIFGAPLAIEAIGAFFLESTFLGLWVFGWNKVSKKTHALSIWLVAFASNLSALLILLANGWMQEPAGYILRNGRAELTDFGALLLNPYGWLSFAHALFAGCTLSAFFVMAISAHHLLAKKNVALFKASFRTAATLSLAASLLLIASGDRQGLLVARSQPTKLAAMESHWETVTDAPFILFLWPDSRNEKNLFEGLKIPHGLSFMAYHRSDAEVKGLRDFPRDERPPVLATFLSFRLMVACGLALFGLAFVGWLRSRRDRLEAHPALLRLFICALPLPYLAVQLGWIVAEVGRQPWLVFGVLRTADGVSRFGNTRPGVPVPGLFYRGLWASRRRGCLSYSEVREERPGRGIAMTLQILWFVLWGILWAAYFVLDGFDLGTGILYGLLGRDEGDRAVLRLSLGPVWGGNEVWLITAGGATFAAFPAAYAAIFSSLYIALLIVLFSLILRGVSLEFRGLHDSAGWRRFWDASLVAASFVTALLFGAAFGNLFRGLAIDETGFRGTFLSLLSPYALVTGVFFVLLFCGHGALWAAFRTDGPLASRALGLARKIWLVVPPAAVAYGILTAFSTDLAANYRHHFYWAVVPSWLVLALVLAGLSAFQARTRRGFYYSCAAVALTTFAGFIGLYPRLVPSRLGPSYSLTIFNASSSPLTLRIMAIVALVLVPAVVAYQAWVYRVFREKIPSGAAPGCDGY